MVCARESDKVFDAGGLTAVMTLLIQHSDIIHKDTMRSCMNVVTRLVPRMEPKDSGVDECVTSLSVLLEHNDPQVSEPAMKSFVALADRFIRRGKDPAPIASEGVLKVLIQRLSNIGQPSSAVAQASGPGDKPSGQSVNTIVNLFSTLCRGSPTITHVGCGLRSLNVLYLHVHVQCLYIHIFGVNGEIIFHCFPPFSQTLLRSDLPEALECALRGDER